MDGGVAAGRLENVRSGCRRDSQSVARVEGNGRVRSVSRVDWTAFVGSVRERKRVRFQTKIRAKVPKMVRWECSQRKRDQPAGCKMGDDEHLEFVLRARSSSSCNDGVE